MNKKCEGINITETEWKIMELLWDSEGTLTMGDILEGLKEYEWSDSTVKTLTRRLCAKGAINALGSSGSFRYSPAVSQEECSQREARDFAKKFYRGSLKMMFASLAGNAGLSAEDEKQLRNLIEKMRDDQ